MVAEWMERKIKTPIPAGTSVMARGTTLIPIRRWALSGVRPGGLYSCPANGGQLRLSYSRPNPRTDFRSRLREDFRSLPTDPARTRSGFAASGQGPTRSHRSFLDGRYYPTKNPGGQGRASGFSDSAPRLSGQRQRSGVPFRPGRRPVPPGCISAVRARPQPRYPSGRTRAVCPPASERARPPRQSRPP